MSIQSVKVSNVLVNDSLFSLNDYLFEPEGEPACHYSTFDTLGILFPIILYKGPRGMLHLVDGKKRIQFSIKSRADTIRATILSASTPMTDILALIRCNKQHEIQSSIVNKLQFLFFVSSLNVPESWVLNSICGSFDFKPHNDIIRECERIYNLPGELKLFCHEKRFSMKQLLNLTYHPKDLLKQLAQWRSTLHLTASSMEEIASNLKDYLRANNLKLKDFLQEPDVEDIIESSLSPREKTEKLRRYISMKRFPILSDVNGRIEKTVNRLKLPKGMALDWDKTLENKNVNLTISITNPDTWKDVLSTVKSKDIQKAIESILSDL